MTYCKQTTRINWNGCPRAANERNTRNWPEGVPMSQAYFNECYIEGDLMENLNNREARFEKT